MDSFGGSNPILARYFAGEASLDEAATEMVRVCKDLMQAAEHGHIVRDVVRRSAPCDAPAAGERDITEADIPRLRALMERVEAKLDLINEGARKYLATAGDSEFDHAVRLLANDVRATLGERHVPVVWSNAAHVRSVDGDADRCIEDVQQYFQDTFVDTTWPACPRHPNHPLDFADGYWRCPRDRSAVAKLGALTREP